MFMGIFRMNVKNNKRLKVVRLLAAKIGNSFINNSFW